MRAKHQGDGEPSPTRRGFLAVAGAFLATPAGVWRAAAAQPYAWRTASETPRTLGAAFAPPPGFARVAVTSGSFADWLRGLPLKPDGAPVLLYSGAEKPRQDVHAAVIDIDVGSRDLQQCADAVMRLRAEWLFGENRAGDIAFDVTEGGRVPFSRWANGERVSPNGKVWKKSAAPDASYESFRRYMDFIFAYAGTASLEKELRPVEAADIEAGDVFIKGGFPGHAVLVADVVRHATTRAPRFLLVQSYMPAQQVHVLKNLANGDGSPWYAPPIGDLVTPEWTFSPKSLRRWP